MAKKYLGAQAAGNSDIITLADFNRLVPLFFSSLPSTQPTGAGKLWLNNGVLTITTTSLTAPGGNSHSTFNLTDSNNIFLIPALGM